MQDYFNSLSNLELASAWIKIDQHRVKNGPRKGAITMRALKSSDMILKAARQRSLVLPVEGMTLSEWNERYGV